MTCPRCQGFMVKDDVTDYFVTIKVMRCVNCSHTIDLQKVYNADSNMWRHRVDKPKKGKGRPLQHR